MAYRKYLFREELSLFFAKLFTSLSLALSEAAFAHGPPDYVRSASVSFPDAEQLASVEDLRMGDGSSQRLLFYGPIADGKGAIVMFPGGTGKVGVERTGKVRNNDNFVVRTRQRWAQKGYGVVIVDALNGGSLEGVRSTAAYAQVVRAILSFVHSKTRTPIWVMGTSQGSIAAMRAASMSAKNQLAGVVLTESVSVRGKSHETVFDSNPENVRAPALVVANRDDQCWVAPPDKAQEIAASMSHASPEVLRVEGGEYASHDTCGSLSPHGYWGMDEEVVDEISEWMTRRLKDEAFM